MSSNDYPNSAGSPAEPQPDRAGAAEPADIRSYQPGYGQSRYQPATASYPPVAPSYPGYQHGGYPSGSGYQPGGGYPQGGGYGGWPPGYSSPAGPDESTPAPASLRRRPLVVLALVAALIGGGVGGGIVALVDRSGGKSVNTGLRITNSTAAPAAKLDGTVSAAAAKIRPSVVTINVAGQQEAGTGSGVIIRPDGTVLTNDHVVDIANGAGNIQVVLSDGRTAPGKILGRDTSDDLAVIQVDGLTGLTAAPFAQ